MFTQSPRLVHHRRTLAIVPLLLALAVLPARGTAQSTAPPGQPYNVLFIIIDDVAANVRTPGVDSPVRTPNIERLAARGTWFTRAYNVSPACNPSRMALITGVHASRSGVYYNSQKFPENFIKDALRLPVNFREHGYLAANFGKLMHTRQQYADDFTPGYAFFHNIQGDVTHRDKDLQQHIIPGTLREATSQNFTWGVLPDDWDRDDPEKLQQDTQQANRTITFLQERHDKPFFVSCGFWRPHVTWEVPQRYYDMYPLDEIELPKGYKPGDLDDLPTPGRWIAKPHTNHADITERNLWRKCLQGYYASTSYIDDQIGRVLDALEQSEYADKTIIVFFSDNGMHLGEKDHWLKYALWEQTCNVLLGISVPGYPDQVAESAVSLIDIYPTLVNLTPIPAPHQGLDGIDLTPLLAGRTTERGRPVLQTYGRGNHAVSDAGYRYIRYRNGDEELYDHNADPHEFTNLADDPAMAAVRTRLRESLPEHDAPDTERFQGKRGSTEWRAASYEESGE